jgi:hypothetical protein
MTTYDVNLLTPFTQVPRRSVTIAASTTLFNGRWAALDSSSNAIVNPGAVAGYLILEGNAVVTAFDTNKVVTTSTSLPSAVASNQTALAYGVYRAEVDAHGYIITSIGVGDGLEIDSSGRLIKLASGVRVATCEAVSATKLVFRTLGV